MYAPARDGLPHQRLVLADRLGRGLLLGRGGHLVRCVAVLEDGLHVIQVASVARDLYRAARTLVQAPTVVPPLLHERDLLHLVLPHVAAPDLVRLAVE